MHSSVHGLGDDAVEVMGLIQIAHEDGHLVDSDLTQWISVRHADGTIAELEIPRVLFSETPQSHASTS